MSWEFRNWRSTIDQFEHLPIGYMKRGSSSSWFDREGWTITKRQILFMYLDDHSCYYYAFFKQ